MRLDDLVAYCLAKPGAEETYPFDEEELVVKVGGKAFAFVDVGGGSESFGVKCGRTADEAAPWRERYPDAVTTSAYIGRHGWNRVRVGGVPDDEIRELVDGSYDDVVARLPKRLRPGGVPPTSP